MKISSELSTGVRLAGTTVTNTPHGRLSQVQPVDQADRSAQTDPEQSDMKNAGIGRKLDIKV